MSGGIILERNRRMQVSCIAVMTLALCVGTAFGMKYGTRKDAAVFTSGTPLSQRSEEEWTQIQLGDSGTDGAVMICQGGKYRISGTLEEGQICVDTADGEKVVLCLAGIQISNSAEAAVYIKNAEETTIQLEEGTENILQSGSETAAENTENTENAADAENTENTENAADAENTENTVNAADTENTENEEEVLPVKAAVYAKDDLTITGEGALNVYGYIRNGIHTTNHLTINSGTIRVEAADAGIKGKDSVTITGGDFTVISGGDGIKSHDTAGEGYGQISISGGTFRIESGGDGMQAETTLAVSGGDFTVISGGGSEAAPDAADRGEGFFGHPGGEGSFMTPPDGMEPPLSDGGGEEMAPPMDGQSGMDGSEGKIPSEQERGDGMPPTMPDNDGQGFPEMPEDMEGKPGAARPERGVRGDGMSQGWPEMAGPGVEETAEESEEEENTPSCKGLKSGTGMEISGGTFTIDACDDAFHSDGTILVSDGALFMKSGDDGIHADTELIVTGGSIEVETCYEGLEANQIKIEDGQIRITSSDDGINANGGRNVWRGRGMRDMEDVEENEEEMPNLCISGGAVLVNAGGDGLDSNGNLTVLGGTVIVDGPSDNGSGALDSGSESGGRCMVHGGLVLAIGSFGMAESFDSDSEQCFFSCRVDSGFQAGSVITVTDMEGQIRYTHTAAKEGASVVFSCPELTKGETVFLDVDGRTQEVEISHGI